MFVFLVIFVYIRHSYFEGFANCSATQRTLYAIRNSTVAFNESNKDCWHETFSWGNESGLNREKKSFFLSFLAPEHVRQQTWVCLKSSPSNSDVFHGLFNSKYIHWHQTIFFIRSVIFHNGWHLILRTGGWSIAYPLSSPTHSLPGD